MQRTIETDVVEGLAPPADYIDRKLYTSHGLRCIVLFKRAVCGGGTLIKQTAKLEKRIDSSKLNAPYGVPFPLIKIHKINLAAVTI